MSFAIPVLHVSEHELVVWKPPALPSELPRDPVADSLVTRLRDEGMTDLRLVHRLDAPASGVMLIARTADAAAYYSAEIAGRRWHKIYIAEVACAPDRARELVADHRAYLDTDGRRARVVRSGGKPSFLSIVHAAPVEGRPGRTHVLIRLLTGRFHQIRVMLAHLGAPLAGDPLYGGPPGAFYLEHVVLGAQPMGSSTTMVWRAPADADRPRWSTSMAAAVDDEASRISEG